MTDITELALRLKLEAHRAVSNFNPQMNIKTRDLKELVEALERKEEQRANWFQMAQKLGEDLDSADKRIAELESRTVTDWIEHDGKWRPESLGLDELVYLKTRKQELKIPYPAGKVKGWMNTGGDMDVMAYKLASPQASTVTAAAADVLAERKRQVTTEGWTPEHDDQHVNFEMAIAGGLYAISAVDSHHKLRNSAPSAWPWDRKWWKPDGPRRDLVKAGALILAEIERLDRAAGIKVEVE
ncbi:TPA: hypothetical protein P3M49_005761 [Klebsiella pneumoniae]|uniref:hypothetical protein n=2 Tax=Klebsiella pneumoniae TaxID=573 RepID=UPI003308B10A|nr:hypothetical protein [Klebsiella pneumoniae]HDO7021944.1 hypothetical protein [Klebsiella pneumoniae]